MAEWLVEHGIGETRAALVDYGAIVEARIERHGALARYGAVLPARLRSRAGRAGRAEAELEDGSLVLVSPAPVSEGATLLVEIIREAIPERGNPKLPLARPVEGPARPAPDLEGRTVPAHGPDLLEEAGWSELLDQAETGLVPFPGGLLRIELTSAMTVIDVDGELPAAELAKRGAAAAGEAIRRFGITGSIGIDLPTLPDKTARQAAAEALDAVLPQPFERTAVNGFGFLQLVRRRVRPSLLELIQSDPTTAEALALLRRLEREPLPGRDKVTAPPAVARLLAERRDWLEELARRRGRPIGIVPA
ncbi:ribonuclease [Sphingomonas sp.]|uniref:ribonuclease n=1 Tax=Sphingomonas sp. TaxID=28214 RepID=UPI002DEFA448|nr:ribonuclease [Sphingomonas sp.]